MADQPDSLILSIYDYGPVWLRRSMVHHFGGSDSAAANALLQRGIQDGDATVRLAVLEVVATPRRQTDLTLLSGALGDAQVAVRAAAAHALGQYQSVEVGSMLQRALLDQHPDVRTAAVLALGQVPTLQFSASLENALADQDTQVRAAAALSLGRVGRPEARVPLQAMAARDPDYQNRQIARQSMEGIQKRAARPEEKKHQASVDLIRVLVDPRRSWEERQRAKAGLVRIGDESLISELDSALKASNDDQIRMDIVDVLAELPAGQQLQMTLLAYLHQAPAVRRRVIVALGRIGDEKAIYYLSEAAREGDRPGQRLTREDARLAREAIQSIRERTKGAGVP